MRFELLVKIGIKFADLLDDKRTGFILEPREIGQTTRSGVRDRQDIQTEMAGSIMNWDEMTVGHSIAMDSADTADNVHIQCGQQGARGLQSAGRVVIAGNHDNLDSRPCGTYMTKRSIKELLGFAGGVLAIENVAGNEYDIYLTLCDDLYKLIEDGEMLRLSAVPAKGVADVPVSGV